MLDSINCQLRPAKDMWIDAMSLFKFLKNCDVPALLQCIFRELACVETAVHRPPISRNGACIKAKFQVLKNIKKVNFDPQFNVCQHYTVILCRHLKTNVLHTSKTDAVVSHD